MKINKDLERKIIISPNIITHIVSEFLLCVVRVNDIVVPKAFNEGYKHFQLHSESLATEKGGRTALLDVKIVALYFQKLPS